MRRSSVAVLALGLVVCPACSEPAGAARTCGGVPLDGAALLLASSFQASGLGRIAEDGCLTEIPDIALGVDPSLALGQGGPFVIARSEALVHAFDPDTLAITRTLVAYADDAELEAPFVFPGCSDRQTHGINPHDADFDAAGRLWVARYEKPTIGIIAADGSFAGTVDLSMYADADGLPEVEAIRVVGDRVHAVLELLDRCNGYKPSANGAIVSIDAETRTVAGLVDLGGKNPFGRMKPVPWDPTGDTVAIALPGDFFAIDEGNAAVQVKLSTGEVAPIAFEAVLDGSIAEVALAAPDEGYAIVAGVEPQNPTRLVAFDPRTGAPSATLLDTRAGGAEGNYDYTGLAVVGAHVLVGDRAYGAPAIHVIERATGREVGTIRPERLPPVSLVPSP